MASPHGKATVIVGSDWSKKTRNASPADLLSATEIEFELKPAEAPGHATELAREAVEQGSGYLISFGDDWTLHEIVNGLLNDREPVNPELVVGVVPTPPGSDFLRTFGLSSSPQDAIIHLDGEPFFEVDVGRLTSSSGDRDDQRSNHGVQYFVNMAQVGLGAEIVRRAGRLPSQLGRVAQLASFWMTMGTFKTRTGKVEMDRRTYEGPVTNVVVANGQFYRQGIRFAVKAHPGDGKFDVLIQKGSKRDYVEGMTKSFKGEHLPSKVIKEYMATRAEVNCPMPLPVEADGRAAGLTPATFEIVHKAFRLKI